MSRVQTCSKASRAGLRVTEVHTVDETLVEAHRDGAGLYMDSEVVQDSRVIGRTVTEPCVALDHGTIRTLSGQPQLTVRRRRN